LVIQHMKKTYIAVSEILPIKQGLKPFLLLHLHQSHFCLRDTSNKTRIETSQITLSLCLDYCLRDTSNKTRIETTRAQAQEVSRPWSQRYFQ